MLQRAGLIHVCNGAPESCARKAFSIPLLFEADFGAGIGHDVARGRHQPVNLRPRAAVDHQRPAADPALGAATGHLRDCRLQVVGIVGGPIVTRQEPPPEKFKVVADLGAGLEADCQRHHEPPWQAEQIVEAGLIQAARIGQQPKHGGERLIAIIPACGMVDAQHPHRWDRCNVHRGDPCADEAINVGHGLR